MEAVALAAALMLRLLNMAGSMALDQNLCSTALTLEADLVFVAQGRAGLFAAYRTSKLDHNRTLDARRVTFGSTEGRNGHKIHRDSISESLSARQAAFVI
jgi:hypothetical protein